MDQGTLMNPVHVRETSKQVPSVANSLGIYFLLMGSNEGCKVLFVCLLLGTRATKKHYDDPNYIRLFRPDIPISAHKTFHNGSMHKAKTKRKPRTDNSHAKIQKQRRIHSYTVMGQRNPSINTRLPSHSNAVHCEAGRALDELYQSTLNDQQQEPPPDVGSDISWPGALRQPGMDSSSEASYSSTTSIREAQSPCPQGAIGARADFASEAKSGRKRKRNRQKLHSLYRSSLIGQEEKVVCLTKGDQNACEFVKGSMHAEEERVHAYDPETEKMYGAPPGGRVFRFNEGNEDEGAVKKLCMQILKLQISKYLQLSYIPSVPHGYIRSKLLTIPTICSVYRAYLGLEQTMKVLLTMESHVLMLWSKCII